MRSSYGGELVRVGHRRSPLKGRRVGALTERTHSRRSISEDKMKHNEGHASGRRSNLQLPLRTLFRKAPSFCGKQCQIAVESHLIVDTKRFRLIVKFLRLCAVCPIIPSALAPSDHERDASRAGRVLHRRRATHSPARLERMGATEEEVHLRRTRRA